MVATKETPKPDKHLGMLAEFSCPKSLVNAAKQLRGRGYKGVDAFSPFPIHGLDDALEVRSSQLPWLVLFAGIVGGVSAIAFQWWTNAVDYPYLISGTPLFSLPANIPVTFEVIILAAAFAAFVGMLMINGLPRLANPLLRNERFRAATNDGFFLFVPGEDNDGESEAAQALLRELGGEKIEVLRDVDESPRLPKGIILAGTVLGALALIPPVVIASARSTKSEKPRLHNFFDMDFQPKFKSQTTSKLFTDGRAMRPRVDGTIPRGQLKADSRLYYGTEASEERQDDVEQRGDQTDEVSPDEPTWVQEVPISATNELIQQGRERFNIHCAVCHGRAGQGNGLASLRALELQQGTWVPPTSIHADHVKEQPDGQLFNTITNGVRKMPAYGHQIDPEDRWAIVLYMRALQRSQSASLEDVANDMRPALRETN